LRTKDGREVDFALIKGDQIEQIIEVKNSFTEISKSLYGFHTKYHLPSVQIVKEIRNDRLVGDIKVVRAENFLAELFL
jgi:uncharacterized protein